MKTVFDRARGAKPPAKIFWYHGSTRILDQGLWHADNDDGDNDDGPDDGHDGDDLRGDDGEESIFGFTCLQSKNLQGIDLNWTFDLFQMFFEVFCRWSYFHT